MTSPHIRSRALPPRASLYSAFAAATAATLAAPAYAQGAADGTSVQLAPVTVSGQAVTGSKTDVSGSAKYAVPLLDVPQTITVVPRQVLDEQNAPQPAAGPVQCLGHHLQRGRRRRRFRRLDQHPWFQRQREHAGGRPARQRADQPQRPLQPRLGGSHQGAQLGLRRLGHHRRQHQHDQQAAQVHGFHRNRRAPGHRPLQAAHGRHQPDAGQRRLRRLPPEPDGPWQRRARP